ncbi:MAG: helix-turn-helix domain-containing protein [Janthinobacterium lividum]
MLENPFAILERRLNRLETLLVELKDGQSSSCPDATEVGGIELAQQVTRLSKPRIYALVSTRGIPHSKRGNKLYFNRAELLAWVAAGKRGETKTVANA